MKLLLFICIICICHFYSAQRKQWTNSNGEEVKKDIATNYYTLSKTEIKTYILKRYYRNNDSLYEEINYPTKELATREGVYKRFFENGKIAEQGIYLSNLKSGIWKHYHKDGTLKESITFKKGLKDGAHVDYLNNIAITKYRYLNNKLNAITLLNDEQANQIFKEDTSNFFIYTFVDQEAEFPGGKKALLAFLEHKNKEAKTSVYLSFNVDKKGIVTEIGLNPLTNENIPESEIKLALKKLAKMPKWEPAMKRGRAVKSSHTVKITIN